MARPARTSDNRFLSSSSPFDLMAETAPHVLDRWATLYLPAQDEPVRAEILRARNAQPMRDAA